MTRPIKSINQPLVSIITPLYNSERYILETISSIQNQTYNNWELIIIDDASEDESILKTEKLIANDSRIQIIKLLNNKGAAFCRNKATEIAKGTYIAFIDSDDIWHPQKLEKQIDFMIKNKNSVSYTSYLKINEKGQLLNKKVIALKKLTYKKQYKNNYIGNLTGIYNAEKLGKIFAPNIRKRQDWALWLEAIKRNKMPAFGLQKELAFYRVRKKSISANKINLLKYNYAFYNKHLGHSKISSMFYLFRFLFEYFFIRPKQIRTYK
jgi:glycosyltransferase involved in cell wall biosynthesis